MIEIYKYKRGKRLRYRHPFKAYLQLTTALSLCLPAAVIGGKGLANMTVVPYLGAAVLLVAVVRLGALSIWSDCRSSDSNLTFSKASESLGPGTGMRRKGIIQLQTCRIDGWKKDPIGAIAIRHSLFGQTLLRAANST